MNGIVGFAITNWRMTIGIMIFIVIGGIMAMSRLSIDAEPDVPVPVVNVRVVLPGVSPEDGERLLIKPMETELKSVEGLKQMDGIAATSVVYMILEFNASFDQDQAVSDVIEKVDRARAEFPAEAKEPIVEELNMSTFPMIVINLFGSAPERELQKRAKIIQKELEGIPQVLEAKITGEREDVLEAILDPAIMESANISFEEIAAAISRNNALITAGAVETETGRFNVKLPGLIANIDDLENLVVRNDGNGGVIRISDLAQVRRGYKDISSYSRFNGQPSVSLQVSKRTGENIVDTIEKIRAKMTEITSAPDWPSTIETAYSQDKSQYTREMITSLFSSIINAVILVFIVCIAALGLRSALFVGWAIPASFLMALFMFYLQGQPINMMIMFGLILSVGVLVDAAIVIIEYADRKLAEGLPRKEAFQTAGERMFWPIITSTATTLAAFIPLLFWDDITGKFMSFLPLTMIYVLTASMIMALIFLPTMGSLIGPRKVTKPTSNLKALSGAEGDPSKVTGLLGVYIRFIREMIQRPIFVIVATLLLLFIIVSGFRVSMAGPPAKPLEFFTQDSSDQIFVVARARGNSTPAADLSIAKELERRLSGIADIDSAYTIAGAGASQGGAEGFDELPIDTVAQVFTELVPFAERQYSVSETIAQLRQATDNIPGVYTEIIAGSQGPPVGKDIAIELSGLNQKDIVSGIEIVRQKLAKTDGIHEIGDSLPVPGVDWELIVDRVEAGRLGLDVARIGSAIQFVTEGALVAKYRPEESDEEIDIRIRYPEYYRDLKALDNLRILTPSGAVPLSSVVKRLPKSRQDTITRRNQKLVFEINANSMEGFATNAQVDELKTWLKSDGLLPAGVAFKFLGQAEENASAGQFFAGAGLAILFMMGVILLLQFNSFYHVALTLLAVVLSVFGVLLGLIFYPYISMILTLTGIIALAGIIVNNNIVLIDTYQRLLQSGYDPEDAALRTAAQRLRPVLLTSITCVVGLMPLVLGWQADI
ncbi:MAG: efflux RND transporter permease subunit, partial [Hellea sp.]|nr:efflux RND transporter permease subunit [Hellea sp.]